MPAAADASKHHESDSEDDLDYVPEGGERGMIYTVGLLFGDLYSLTFRLGHRGGTGYQTPSG